MKTMHKFLAVVISAALAAGLLAGCGAASSTASSAASSEVVSSVAASSEAASSEAASGQAAAGFVTTVNGETADWDKDQAWWCLTDATGEMTTVGVADIALHDGDSYAFIYTK